MGVGERGSPDTLSRHLARFYWPQLTAVETSVTTAAHSEHRDSRPWEIPQVNFSINASFNRSQEDIAFFAVLIDIQALQLTCLINAQAKD